ncbi:HAD-IA family hydrolase [Patescibacteria group bacterium]|nr:HAD-IA family hydrolase [Patescibacteria group bacterium]MBU1256268.1 HAD-IA family hydrolase [Patescibacteria group bacterium]MBU1457798.1 HAD-IA family hydrolase [Patescibacteria group bacterium]
MKYKVVGFDYGGVVAGRPAGEFVESVSNHLGVSVQDFNCAYFKHNSLFNDGSLSFEEFWKKVLKDLGKVNRLQDLINYLKQLPPKEVNQAVIDLIKDLRRNGCRVGLLSNNSKKKAGQIRKKGLGNYFDVMLFSGEIGFSKPDPKTYQLFCNQFGVDPAELIFVDDVQHNLDILPDLGIHPILFTTLEDLVKELVSLRVLAK